MYYRMKTDNEDPEELAARTGVYGPNLVGNKLLPGFYRRPKQAGTDEKKADEEIKPSSLSIYATCNQQYGAHLVGEKTGRSISSPAEQLKEARAVIRDMKALQSIDHTWEIIGSRPAAVQDKLTIWDENGAIEPSA
jgi:hypothetical protein